ncbi:MAG: glycosyltransferase family 4 protein [Calditrichae bacterium]|nr:glycosyltransferase family 4 protein [Calditrichia bacterium]
MKKVLIVTYHWPPAGGPGVQRILKFAKYLPEFGWQPLVLTVKDGEYPALDPTLEKDIPKECKVFRSGSLEPNSIYKKLTGMKASDRIPTAVLSEKKRDWKSRLAAWVRLNIFIPDAKRGWLPFAVRKGAQIIKSENPDIIFSSSPPPTTHLIARKLARRYGLKWVADFRDPWTDIHYYENLPRLDFVKKIDRNLEHKVLDRADKIISISRLDIEMDFSKKISQQKCINIPNGYDDQDFKGLPVPQSDFPGFLMMHLGAIGKERVPVNLFKAIQILSQNEEISAETFRLELVGKNEPAVWEYVEKFGITRFVKASGYVPHKQAVAMSGNASCMLLLVTQSEKNKRILPGKTFEYMNTGKPILALGPEDGEVARILLESKTGVTIDYGDEERILAHLRQLLKSEKEESMIAPDLAILKKYNRRNLTADLVRIFDEVINT